MNIQITFDLKDFPNNKPVSFRVLIDRGEESANDVTQEDSTEIGETHTPVAIEDKPLLTITGKPMNNEAYIQGRRKFIWADKRVPDLVAEYFLSNKYIFDYQLKDFQEFLQKTKCSHKIVFDGNGNIIATVFFKLISEGYLKTSKDFLAERIEAIFVRKDETLRALIKKNTFKSSLRPGSILKRIKPGVRNYPDIVAYLSEKLKLVGENP